MTLDPGVISYYYIMVFSKKIRDEINKNKPKLCKGAR